MKLISIGVVKDINDPRGFGRIRVSDKSEGMDSIRANSINTWDGTPWSKDDPFVYSPFLPNHINIIPKVEQSVKIIRYDTERDTQNQEYIPGPYTTPHDFSSQPFEVQISETTLGIRSKKTPNIKSFSGNKKVYDDNFIRAESVGSLPKVSDIAVSGNYGSDVILTEHGVILRAGKFVDKLIDNPKLKEDLNLYPTYSKKQSRLYLKKFPETLVLAEKKITDTVVTRTDIKHLFEYELDSIAEPTTLTFYIYRINKSEGDKYKTDVFNIDSELGVATSELIYREEIILQSDNKTQEAYILTRDFIARMDREKLHIIEPTLQDVFPHPFYFRPTKSFRVSNLSVNAFLENVTFLKRTSGFGLVFSKDSLEPPLLPQTRIIPYLKKVSDADQTFSALLSDTIFHLSTENSGIDGKKIDFTSLDKYELTQEDYLERILPNTFSSVRGEKLIEILELIVLILLNHTHGIITPPKYFKATTDSLKRLISRAKQDMVNTSVRIN